MHRRLAAAFIVSAVAILIVTGVMDVESGARRVASRNFTELRPQSVGASAAGVSRAVRELAPAAPESGKESGKMGRAEQQARAVPNNLPFRKQVVGADSDPPAPAAVFSRQPMPAIVNSFEGISSNDNFAAYGFRIFPPDTIGDVGPDHYVQAANALFRVFDKSGNPLTPPLKMSSLFAVLNTGCSIRDDGDPIVLYDTLADRWILSQFCKKFPPFRQMIAVSMTGDPTGAYFVYEFVMPNVKQNDYPKLGVWGDAFYMTTDEFYGSTYTGTGIFAFDREKMLSGDPSASYIYFDLASPTTLRIGGLLPADLDGTAAPPASAPGLLVGYTATEYGDPQDAVRLFEFHADFNVPENSTFSEASGSPFAVAPFDPTSNPGRDDVLQPPPGEKLDSQSDRLMYRAAYRVLGSRASLVVNQTVRVSPAGAPYLGGVRVHELVDDGSGFYVRGSSTVAAEDGSRFMGAAAQDHEGNLAVGYSTGSAEKPPSVFYTGRLADDPPGVFRNEGFLVVGTGVQTAFGFRWGDYSGLSVDPSDGCTFWITNQYYSLQSQNESPFGWLTRVGNFRFAECEDKVSSEIAGTVSEAETGRPIEGAVVRIEGGHHRMSGTDGSYGPFRIPPGSYQIAVSAAGYASQSAVVDASSGGAIIEDFVLVPTAVIVESGFRIVEESCSMNNAAEPGETVAVEIPLRNLGARGTSNLVAALQATAGVGSPSAPRSYGAMPPNGPPVSRSFSFTVSSDLKCGSPFSLVLKLSDEGKILPDIVVPLNAGRVSIPFSENFDGVKSPALPEGWATTAEGGQMEWTTSIDQAESLPNAAFSPDPRQVGLNELVSPPIPITSPNARLKFRNWYELETTFLRNRLYDGSVLEIKIGDQDWQDILDAGGSFTSGGYDEGVIDSCCQNPLAGRRGWSGRSGVNEISEFIDTEVDLPPSAAGSDVRFRWRVGTDIGTFRTGQFIDDLVVTDGFVCDCVTKKAGVAPFDFDGDAVTDLSVYNASDDDAAPDLRVLRSSDGRDTGFFWGSAGDLPANSDYDGDGRTDLAVFRPSTRIWFILNSSDSSISAVEFGYADDLAVPADYDGDGLADIAVFRPSEGSWFVMRSTDGNMTSFPFGVAGDIPVPADYDGDGASDVAVFRPSDGVWYVSGSSGVFSAVQFGLNGDLPVPGDYDGDGRADRTVFRPTEGNWYLLGTTAGFSAVRFGIAGDRPLQGDFDGDGRSDIALFRTSESGWYAIRSSDGSVLSASYGAPGSQPVPGIYVR